MGTTPTQFVITDTFSQLVTDFNTVALDIGATGRLTTNQDSDLTSAINELEVGIRGTSNNLVATDLTTTANDLVAAINEIEGVFDASAFGISAAANNFDVVSGTFSVDAGGAITLDATGDVVLKDAGVVFSTLENSSGNLILKSGSTTALTFTGANIVSAGTFETGGTTTVGGELILGNETITRTGDLTVDVSGDIKLNADDADILLQDASATYGGFTNSSGDLIIKSGTSTLLTGSGENGTFNNNLTVENNLTVTGQTDLNGHINLGDAAADTISVVGHIDTNLIPSTDGTHNLGSASLEWNDAFFDGTVTTDALVSPTADLGNFDITSDTITNPNATILDLGGDLEINVDGGDIVLKDDTATFGGLTNTSGNLIIKSGTTTAMTFSGANVTMGGTITPSISLTTTATTLAAAVNENKSKIPAIYNAAGTQLN